MRIQFGEAGKLAKLTPSYKAFTLLTFAAFPILAAFRLIQAAKDGKAAKPINGVLAILATQERILMTASKSRPARPETVISRIPASVPIVPDLKMMQEYMVAQITLGSEVLTVNGSDFRDFRKAVEHERIEAPAIKTNLAKLTPYTERWSTQEPEAYVRR